MRHRIITTAVDQPAAGKDFSFVPSNGDCVRLLSLTAKLVTSSTAASRIVALSLADLSSTVYWSVDAVETQAASLSVYYTWARGVSLSAATTLVGGERVGLSLPDLWLEPGDTVASITGSIETGDQWEAIVWRGIVGDRWERQERIAELAAEIAGYGG